MTEVPHAARRAGRIAAIGGLLVWIATLAAVLHVFNAGPIVRPSEEIALAFNVIDPPTDVPTPSGLSSQANPNDPANRKLKEQIQTSTSPKSETRPSSPVIGPGAVHDARASAPVTPPRAAAVRAAERKPVATESAPAKSALNTPISPPPPASDASRRDASIATQGQGASTKEGALPGPGPNPMSDSGADVHASAAPEAGAARESAGTSGTGSSHARALAQPLPAIPDEARDEALTAVALARFTVHADGQCEVTLLSATHNPTLNRLLLASLKQWRFAPATQGGHSVDSTVVVRVHFNVQ